MSQLRALRALFTIALTWAIAWIPLAFILLIGEALLDGHPFREARFVADIPMFAAVGAICGFAFGLIMALTERRRAFSSLSAGRMSLWGIAGAMVIPLVATLASGAGFGANAEGFIVYGVLGGLSAVSTLVIARRAPLSLGEVETQRALPASDGHAA